MSQPKKRKKPPDLSLPWPPSIDFALAAVLSLTPRICSACSLSTCDLHLQNLALFSAFGFVGRRFLKNWGCAKTVGCMFWMDFWPAWWPEISTLFDGVAYDVIRHHEQGVGFFLFLVRHCIAYVPAHGLFDRFCSMDDGY